jgi:hypothetical protein
MRRSILALALAGALPWAGAAAGQGMGMGMAGAGFRQPMQSADPQERFSEGRLALPSAREVYARDLIRLKQKMQRLAAEDGGQLSPAHQAALQQELDAINRAYAGNSMSARR